MKKRYYPQSLEELVSDMENYPDQYENIKIFLRRKSHSESSYFGKQYLAVTSTSFCLCRINDIDYKDGEIFISLTDTTTNEDYIHSVNIQDSQPSAIFIQWKDILNLMSERRA